LIVSFRFIYMETKDLIRAWINWKSAQINDVYTQDMLAREAGIWPSSITDYVKGKREPNKKTIEKIAKALGITVAQFWQGPECMERAEPGRERTVGPDDSEFVYIPYAHKPMHPIGGEEVWVPHYKINFAGGNGVVTAEPKEVELLPFKSEWVRKAIRANPGRLILVDVVGDSMEPTLYEGDTVLVDRDRKDPRRPGIYALRAGGDLIVKRLEYRTGKIIVISDNTVRAVSPRRNRRRGDIRQGCLESGVVEVRGLLRGRHHDFQNRQDDKGDVGRDVEMRR